MKIPTAAGKVYGEAHHDVYRTKPVASTEAYTTLRTLGYSIDWNHVDSVLQKRGGIAEAVTATARSSQSHNRR